MEYLLRTLRKVSDTRFAFVFKKGGKCKHKFLGIEGTIAGRTHPAGRPRAASWTPLEPTTTNDGMVSE
jgi:hypothetical protein